MITIRTFFSEISIDNKKEYAIYDESYEADEYGYPLPRDSEDVKTGNCYSYGHIIIETERKRYTLKKVYSAYEWVADLLDYIDSNRHEENIFINMSELVKSDGNSFREFVCSSCHSELIK